MNNSTLRQAAAANAQAALAEDIGDGDLSASLTAENLILNGRLFCREKTVLCGVPWFEECFLALDSTAIFEWKSKDGEELQKDALICECARPSAGFTQRRKKCIKFFTNLVGNGNGGAPLAKNGRTGNRCRHAQNLTHVACGAKIRRAHGGRKKSSDGVV